MKRTAKLLVPLLILLLFASCSRTPAPYGETPSGQDASQTYSVYHLQSTYQFDRDGLLIPKEEQYTTITHTETGEPLYRVYTRQQDSGEDDEYGNPVVKNLSALYDAQGNLLYDWEEVYYAQGAGSLLLRHSYNPFSMYAPAEPNEDAFFTLWDPASGKEVLEDVSLLHRVTDGIYLALDSRGMMLGTVDTLGNKLHGFPAPIVSFYPIISGGYIIANDQNPYEWQDREFTYYLFDDHLNLLFEGKNINMTYYGLRGNFLLQGEKVLELRSLPELEILYTYPEDTIGLDYFDGERMILRNGSRGSWEYTFCDAEGNPLSETYHAIRFDDFPQSDTPVSRFLAQRSEEIFLLDRNGRVVSQTEIPGLQYVSVAGDGLYNYYIQGEANAYGGFSQLCGLLGPDLSVIISADTYHHIERAYSGSGDNLTPCDLLFCYKSINGMARYDVTDLSGKLLISNLSQIGTVSENRLCAVCGFSIGLMDWQGNWISRYSVHDSLRQDD